MKLIRVYKNDKDLVIETSEGKAAYDRCAAGISGTDGEFAYCSILFHYAEQSNDKRKQMCHSSVKNKYYELASYYSYQLYLDVWKCK